MSKISYTAGAPIPKSLGRCVDELKAVSLLRLEMDKEVKEVKKREAELTEHLLENLAQSSTGVSGRKYRAQVTSTPKPTVEDWEAIYDFVVENDAFEIMAKSLNNKAIEERWANDEQVPGVGKIHVKKLSVTKL